MLKTWSVVLAIYFTSNIKCTCVAKVTVVIHFHKSKTFGFNETCNFSSNTLTVEVTLPPIYSQESNYYRDRVVVDFSLPVTHNWWRGMLYRM